MELLSVPVATLAEKLAKKEITAVELTRSYLKRIAAVEPKVNAFLSWNEADALAQAKASDERRAAGKTLGPLDGIPVGIKDLIAVKGHTRIRGSIWAGRVAKVRDESERRAIELDR